MEKYRITLSSVIDCETADQAQAIAGIIATVLVNTGAQSPKVTVAREPVALCENPDHPTPAVCNDCPNFDVGLDGGAYCRYSLKAIY